MRFVMSESKFLDYLHQIMLTAADGHGDIALLCALVLPDILGQYFVATKKISAKNNRNGAVYIECLRRCIDRDKKRYGLSRLHTLFHKSAKSQKASASIAKELYKLRCNLAHGGNISIPTHPDYSYLHNPMRISLCQFLGNGSVHMSDNSENVWIDINKLIFVLCDIFSFEYSQSSDRAKRYLDDFNRNVYHSVDEISFKAEDNYNKNRGDFS